MISESRILKKSDRRAIGMDITIAPLIDIVFLLLIFFMLITRFLNPAINVDMPRSSTAESLDAYGVLVLISADGSIYVDDQMIEIDQLKQTLSSKIEGSENDSIRIRADRSSEVQVLISVLDIIREMNLTNVAIETEMVESDE